MNALIQSGEKQFLWSMFQSSIFDMSESQVKERTSELLESQLRTQVLLNWTVIYINNDWDYFVKSRDWKLLNLNQELLKSQYSDYTKEELKKLKVNFYIVSGVLFFSDSNNNKAIYFPETEKIEYLLPWYKLLSIQFNNKHVLLETKWSSDWEERKMVYIFSNLWEYISNEKNVSKPNDKEIKVDRVLNKQWMTSLLKLGTTYLDLWVDWTDLSVGDKKYYKWTWITKDVVDWKNIHYEDWLNSLNQYVEVISLYSVNKWLPIFNNKFEEVMYADIKWDTYAIAKNKMNSYYYIYSLKNDKWIATWEKKIIYVKVDKKYNPAQIKVKYEKWFSVVWIKLWEILK